MRPSARLPGAFWLPGAAGVTEDVLWWPSAAATRIRHYKSDKRSSLLPRERAPKRGQPHAPGASAEMQQGPKAGRLAAADTYCLAAPSWNTGHCAGHRGSTLTPTWALTPFSQIVGPGREPKSVLLVRHACSFSVWSRCSCQPCATSRCHVGRRTRS